MENRQKSEFQVLPAPMGSEDAHQSITSVTFHRDHLPTMTPGIPTNHSHVLKQAEQQMSAEKQKHHNNSKPKRSESHDGGGMIPQEDPTGGVQTPYQTGSAKGSEQKRNSNIVLNTNHHYGGSASQTQNNNTTATFPQSTKYAHNFGQLATGHTTQSNHLLQVPNHNQNH